MASAESDVKRPWPAWQVLTMSKNLNDNTTAADPVTADDSRYGRAGTLPAPLRNECSIWVVTIFAPADDA